MKGVVRDIDNLGRLVIPKEIRRELGLSKGEPVQMYVQDNRVIVEKYNSACIICGNTKDVFSMNDKNICYKCAQKIAKNLLIEEEKQDKNI